VQPRPKWRFLLVLGALLAPAPCGARPARGAEDAFDRVRAALAAEDWLGAARLLDGLRGRLADAPEFCLLLGRLRRGEGRPAEAVRLFERALAQAPGVLETLLELALAREALGPPGAGDGSLGLAAAAPSSDAGLLHRLAEALYRRGNYLAAVAALERARRLQPADDRHELFLATCHFARGDAEAAIRILEETARRSPENAYGHYALGYYLAKVGRLPRAVESLRRALALAPGFVEARFQLARIAEGEGEDARPLYRGILEAEPEHPATHAALGRLDLRDGRLAEAEQHLTRALALAPDQRATHYTLGILYSRTGRTEAARREFDAAERLRPEAAAPGGVPAPGGQDRRGAPQLEPGSPAARLLDEAVRAHRQGDAAAAERRYRELIAVAPGLAEARMNLGLLYHDLNRLAEATAELRRSLALAPDLVPANYFLGIDLCLTGDFDGAIAALRRTRALARETPGVSRWLGLSLLGAGRSGDAADELELHLAGAPDDSEALEALVRAADRLDPVDAAARIAPLERLAATYRRLGRTRDAERLESAVAGLRRRR
jgi:Flp pilus assembly protein TadD